VYFWKGKRIQEYFRKGVFFYFDIAFFPCLWSKFGQISSERQTVNFP
jgi:hypothetical protein